MSCLKEPSHCDGFLSTLNICFGREIRQLITWYTIITKALDTCYCKLIFTYRFAQNKFLIRFYNKLFLSILTSFPRDQSCRFYMMCEM